ncbi:MAG: D-alanine--D-alanine ligase family protein [Candidatus Adiutrix sp.]
MVKKIQVALLMGGKSQEREVSLTSGREVLAHIDRRRFEVTVYDPLKDLPLLLHNAQSLDVAFLALHGPYGEDGTMQGFCEMIGLPYIGSGVLASALAINKNATKKIYRDANLPVAPDLFLPKKQAENSPNIAKEALALLGAPIVVKPLNQGSSLGLSLAFDEKSLKSALNEVFALDGEALLEAHVAGREFTCGVLGNDCLTPLPIIEIIPAEGHQFFDYAAKYEKGQAKEICPAQIPDCLAAEISSLAVAAHQALGCRGLSRTDFMVSGRPFLLETNTLPGLTAASLLPQMAKAYGLNFSDLISYLIDLTMAPIEPNISDYIR